MHLHHCTAGRASQVFAQAVYSDGSRLSEPGVKEGTRARVRLTLSINGEDAVTRVLIDDPELDAAVVQGRVC